MPPWTRRALVAAALGIGACTRTGSPPLGALYRPTSATPDQPPLIVIPGAFGSRLRDRRTGEETWPRSARFLLASNYRGLAVDIDAASLEPLTGDIEAWDIFEAGLGRDFYGQVLRTLVEAGGYVRRTPGQAPERGSRNFYIYPYDWRLDNVRAARGLHELIGRIRADYGNPAQQVDVLAHSNGGLLARYYCRYGTAALPESGPFTPTGAGRPAVRRLLLVGTPNFGTIQPVLSHLRGEELVLRQMPQEVVASFSGAPEIMPHPAVPWAVDTRGQVLDYDLYDIGTWQELGWSIFEPRVARRTVARHGGGAAGERHLAVLREYFARHLRLGRRFVESLAVAAPPGSEPPAFIFGGDCNLTLARIVIERSAGEVLGRERPDDITSPRPGVDYAALMFEPGDLVVTRASLLGRRSLDIAAPRAQFESLQVAQSLFLCEQHQQLTGNPSFQDNLLHTLLSVDPA
jgi:hypothetical protein